MASLTQQDLMRIDATLDISIASQQLLSQPRDIALLHMLRYFEDYVRLGQMGAPHANSSQGSPWVKHGLDGLHFAVQWIYQYCPSMPHTPLHTTLAAVYEQAHKLHEAAIHYATIWDFMTLLFRERVVGESDDDRTIRLRSVHRLSVEISVADRLIGAPTSPESSQHFIATLAEFDLTELLREISVQPLGSGKVKYFTPRSTFERMAAYVRHIDAALGELDASWNQRSRSPHPRPSPSLWYRMPVEMARRPGCGEGYPVHR